MSDEPISLDFNNVDTSSAAQHAAQKISSETVSALFERLEAANALWPVEPHGERRAALAALEAVVAFTSGENDYAGNFSRPLQLLRLELANAGKPLKGNILPPEGDKQTYKRNRAQAVQYLQAASAFAAQQFAANAKTTLAPAYRRVAEVLRDHRFPPTEFSGGEVRGSPRLHVSQK